MAYRHPIPQSLRDRWSRGHALSYEALVGLVLSPGADEVIEGAADMASRSQRAAWFDGMRSRAPGRMRRAVRASSPRTVNWL